MKTIQDKQLVTIAYEAEDGVQFASKEECAKYEKSAECYINTAFNKLKSKNLSESDISKLKDIIFDGSECDISIIKPKSQEDVKVICQKLYLNGESNCEKVFRAFEENKTLCLGDNEGYIWVHCIIEDVINMLNSIINNG